jgi:hypothetical protein
VPLLKGAVAAAVIHVGVADDYLVDFLEGETDLPHVGDYDLLRRFGETGIHEDRVVLPEEEVLAHKPSTKVRLYPVDARQYLHHLLPLLVTAHRGAPGRRRATRRPMSSSGPLWSVIRASRA